MKRFLKSEIGAVVSWVIASLFLAAVLSPWICRAGMMLAATTAAGDHMVLLEWIGASAARAKFGRFFDRSLWFSALLLLPFLFHRLKQLKSERRMDVVMQQPSSISWRVAALHACLGLVISSSILWGLCHILVAAGAYVPREHALPVLKILGKVLPPTIAAALIEEWFFRGVLLGLWLRFARPLMACLGTSVLFALLHFMEPPAGTVIADPTHAGAGFELLGKMFFHFMDPLFFVTEFASLCGVGLILAMARVRTGALWFSIGLHAGWILVFKIFNLLHQSVSPHMLRPWGVGNNITSGILPLLSLVITAAVCHLVLRSNRASP